MIFPFLKNKNLKRLKNCELENPESKYKVPYIDKKVNTSWAKLSGISFNQSGVISSYVPNIKNEIYLFLISQLK